MDIIMKCIRLNVGISHCLGIKIYLVGMQMKSMQWNMQKEMDIHMRMDATIAVKGRIVDKKEHSAVFWEEHCRMCKKER